MTTRQSATLADVTGGMLRHCSMRHPKLSSTHGLNIAAGAQLPDKHGQHPSSLEIFKDFNSAEYSLDFQDVVMNLVVQVCLMKHIRQLHLERGSTAVLSLGQYDAEATEDLVNNEPDLRPLPQDSSVGFHRPYIRQVGTCFTLLLAANEAVQTQLQRCLCCAWPLRHGLQLMLWPAEAWPDRVSSRLARTFPDCCTSANCMRESVLLPSQVYTNGDFCHETGQPRHSILVVACPLKGQQPLFVSETAPCSYFIIMYHAALCEPWAETTEGKAEIAFQDEL